VATSDIFMDNGALKLDLRGIKCPLNWAYAKVRLEQMARGERLELMLDDPRGARDIPRAAEAEGYAVIDVGRTGDCWRIRIEK
jgi:TusA-related sulfurtransferase